MTEAKIQAAKSDIPVVDAARFLAAFFVVVSHAKFPPLFDEILSDRFSHLASLILGAPFCGIAAVMVFFIISGFCIHYPAARGRPLNITRFYLTRFTRIGVPLLVAGLIFQSVGLFPELHLILWSIFCEIIYYLLYPLIHWVVGKLGAHKLLWTSFVGYVLFMLVAFYSENGIAGNFAGLGVIGTAVIGLPVWLGGVVLAEAVAKKSPSGLILVGAGMPLWTWRIGFLALVSILNISHFHSPLNYKLTMPLVGLLAVPWIYQEMLQAKPASWLVNAGKACYSIYLMHQLGVKWSENLQSDLLPMLRWSLGGSVATVTIWIFYMMVEKPSHLFARKLGARPVI